MNNTFTITDSAAKRIVFLLSKEKKASKLRISVSGGGCSGFKYEYLFVEEQQDDDYIFEKNGASVIIDPLSLESFMHNATLDFVESLGASQFEIKNPNSKSGCGCGNSFAI